MKKFVFIVAVALCVANVFAGGAKETSTVKDSRPTVRLITDVTGIDDKSFNAAAWRGILSYYGDTWENQSLRGDKYEIVTCMTQDMFIPVIKQVSDESPDLIIVTGFAFADALSEVAVEYPNQKYVIVDVDWVAKDNVMAFVFPEEQGSFLVGVIAALKAVEDKIENPKFGFIGALPGAVITKFEVGYIQGLKAVLPNAEIVDYYANDWGKPELAKIQAKNWFDSGVYTVFSAAGATGNGAIAQAKEYRMNGKNVWAIGVDSDQHSDGIYSGDKSAVLTSMIKRVETTSVYALKAIENNTFKSEVVSLSLKDEGVGYSIANRELSTDLITKVKQFENDIINGKINVIATYKDALAAGKVPAGLGAKDN